MDTTANILQIATAPTALLGTVKVMWDQINNMGVNPGRALHLSNVAETLMKILQSVELEPHLIVVMLQELQSVRCSLDSLIKREASMFNIITASGDTAALAKLQGRLLSITKQVETAISTPTTYNRNLELPEFEVGLDRGNDILDFLQQSTSQDLHLELPEFKVGLDRGNDILDFLQQSKSQDLRVIAIYGQPGVGKTTLLNYVWNKVACKAPFCVRAYTKIGHDANDHTIRQLRTSIMSQLCCGSKGAVPSSGFGRGELRKSLKKLKAQKRPVFLALDNVFSDKDLEDLLPANLGSEDLPASSCIVVTCRDHQIVEALLRICRLQKSDQRVFCFEPPLFNSEESRRLFAESAGMDYFAAKYQDLFDGLVPLCDGLPLALTALGKIFLNESRRDKEEWQLVRKSWENLDERDEGSSTVRRALQLSFDRLDESTQIAFLDMVSTYYGWAWERVERIVDKIVMRNLIKSSLVWKVDSLMKCNQNALREGFGPRPYEEGFQRGWSLTYKFIERHWPPKPMHFIAMHNLTLTFGESIIRGETLGYKQIISSPLSTISPNANELRSVTLLGWDSSLDFLRSATNLQTLTCTGKEWTEHPPIARCILYKKGHTQQLRFLQCRSCISSGSIMEMKASREIKEIVLRKCEDLQELPNLETLQSLERLEIGDCKNFQGFSASVGEWCNLKDLRLNGLDKLTTLPMELGGLSSLEAICVEDCAGLKNFPSLSSPHGPSSLVLRNCTALKTLGPISCPLQTLFLENLPIRSLEVAHVTLLRGLLVYGCQKLVELPAAFINASALQSILIEKCKRLVKLLAYEEIGDMASLTELRVSDCFSLERLPAGLFGQQASSLQVLQINRTGVVTLPAEIGTLNTLIKLSLNDNVMLVELPEQMEGLCSLRKLSLRNCSSLRKFPESILCKMSSLEALNISGVSHDVALKKLLEQMEGLSSLKILKLVGCSQLENLPDSIGYMSSLKTLQLTNCWALTELPEQIGGLTSLEDLNLSLCKKLEKLPDSIGKLSSLRSLNMTCCSSLVELPEQIGGLTSLADLNLSLCWKLEKLPDCIGNMSSLLFLQMNDCKSLKELPEQIGGLTS